MLQKSSRARGSLLLLESIHNLTDIFVAVIAYVLKFFFFSESCGSNQTGEEQLKGVITWNSTKADTNSTTKCPYNINGSAVRFCKLDPIFGPMWMEPDTRHCLYSSKTTNKLNSLSQVGTKVLFFFFLF